MPFHPPCFNITLAERLISDACRLRLGSLATENDSRNAAQICVVDRPAVATLQRQGSNFDQETLRCEPSGCQACASVPLTIDSFRPTQNSSTITESYSAANRKVPVVAVVLWFCVTSQLTGRLLPHCASQWQARWQRSSRHLHCGWLNYVPTYCFCQQESSKRQLNAASCSFSCSFSPDQLVYPCGSLRRSSMQWRFSTYPVRFERPGGVCVPCGMRHYSL
jgi:hypothetical protein